MKRPDNGKRATGCVIYSGASAVDGAPIVAILVWGSGGKPNRKTGSMVQSYILRADVPPVEALKRGLDVSVCGDCDHRSKASGGTGACYVNVGHGPRAVFDGWKRGIYPEATLEAAAGKLLDLGWALRIGTYGDPAAIPGAGPFWLGLATAAGEWTGYTHAAHLERGAELRGVCMASADSAGERDRFIAEGWKTFRVASGPDDRIKGEARCPASAEAGKKVTCATCPMKCNGRNSSVVIIAHGATAKAFKEGERDG